MGSQRRPRRPGWIRAALLAGAALCFAMWLAGLWRYTSVGVDRETLERDGVTVHSRYDRLRWPGDGSLWIGGGYWREPASPSSALETFDLAATLFQPPRRPPAATLWNRIGFWRLEVNAADGHRGESWWGIPGWLPVLVLGLAAVGLGQGSSTASPSKVELRG